MGAFLKEKIKPFANLQGADLLGANLLGANLQSADLQSADLRGANLQSADLRDVNLRGANLYGANLQRADLQGANLQGANLRGADLRGAKNIPFLPQLEILPEGDLIVYKKIEEGVVKLLIPKHAKRSSGTTRKCRASEAIVLELPKGVVLGHSIHAPRFTYEHGATIKPTHPFDEDRWNDCSSGIHFFITRQEAENY